MARKRLTYRVQRGDDYTRIADKLYGDKRYRSALKRQNPKVKKLRPGAVINLLDDDPREMWKKRERGRRKQAASRRKDWGSVKRRYSIDPDLKAGEPAPVVVPPPTPQAPTAWWEDPDFQNDLTNLVESTAETMGLDANVMLDELGLGEGSPLLAELFSTGQAQPQSGSPSSTTTMTDEQKKRLKKEFQKMGLDEEVAMYELGLSDLDPYAWETPQVASQSPGTTGEKKQGDTIDELGSSTAPQKSNFDRNDDYIDSCYVSTSGEELAQCLNNIMQLNYEEAGLDLNELAENPPYENPLGTIEGLDLSWWEPMFFYNQLEDGNAKFLKELGLNWEYPPNYEQNYLEALKEEYHDFWEEIKVGKEYIPTQPIEQIYNPRDYVPYEIDELSFLWGSIRGELPHYRGIAIAETYVPKGGNFWGVDATALAAAIALQSQTYHKEKDTKESLVYKLKDLGGEPSSGLGIAQITDAEMSDFGFEGQDQEDPEVAVRAMAKRIRSALSALELVFGENFNKQDMLIVAALAQNGRGFNAVEIKSTLTDERFIDPEDGSPNWEKYFGERGKPGEVWAGGHQKVFGKQYDTQFMLKLYINDLRELYNRGWELPFGLTEDDLDEVEETYYTNLEFDDL